MKATENLYEKLLKENYHNPVIYNDVLEIKNRQNKIKKEQDTLLMDNANLFEKKKELSGEQLAKQVKKDV